MPRIVPVLCMAMLLAGCDETTSSHDYLLAEGDGGVNGGVNVPTYACWDKSPTVIYNRSLDLALEIAPAVAADRERAFQQAVDDWNAALRRVGAGIQIKVVKQNMSWATAQGAQVCWDGVDSVHDHVDVPYRGDGANVTSTGRNTAKLQPGWILGQEQGSIYIDRRLAETHPVTAGFKLKEADIVWFTHVRPDCTRIPWNYRDRVAAPAGGKVDYYSVMLHELGHFLGLDHATYAELMLDNVMRPTINPGQRLHVLSKEEQALRTLYGPGGACPPPAPGDAGVAIDAGTPPPDAGWLPPDAGWLPPDAGWLPPDAGVSDASVLDAPILDAPILDAWAFPYGTR